MRKFLWITDPWTTLDHPRDTTLRLAEEALALGQESYWCDVRSIRLENSRVRLDAKRILGVDHGRMAETFHFGPEKPVELGAFHSVHYRPDPPVDHAYLHPLQMLSIASAKAPRAEIVNPLEVLFTANEKMEPAQVLGGRWFAPTCVSSRWTDLSAFLKEHGKAVLKPLHDAQSKGVELLDIKKSPKEILARATAEFTRPVLLQKFLAKISEGELRVWFVDGKYLAHVAKLPLAGDFRVNMDRGSRLAEVKLTAQNRKAIAAIGKHLQTRKIRLAAIDLIENFATDFNFTSPGLITPMEGVLGENLAKPIIQALTKRR